jgi:hypothetical protein
MKWTPEEHALAARLKSQGVKNRDIAVAVDRSHTAVVSWVTNAKRAEMWSPPAPRKPNPRAIVYHGDVPRWYALGWRFVGFDGALCIFEWQSDRAPKIPSMEVAA